MEISFSRADDEYLNCNILKIPSEVIEKEHLENLDCFVKYIFDNEIRARKSFFKSDGSVGYGTLCLIDNEDFEIRKNAKIGPNSKVVFILTLHSG
jgi:hypothetical protein